MTTTPILFSEPIKQEAWYKQVREEIAKEKRPIDRMSTLEISEMYRNRTFLCDSCGKELSEREKNSFSLERHIIHIINPMSWWVCNSCFEDDLSSGRIIAMTD